ncbi:hypothetical protein C0Q70_17789 [Pomacea canaliculata]|uniref:EGF-like domain-containing protein n=1 Tax=Pomacea canaliculata TaxID=400727 RepID=A0A2T7NLF2_POMCA|nr:hypothetical protein C0Q70_17789 [Pomacea canaliculata]
MKRVERCENGGTFLNGRCRCPMEFAGETCQRRIRDCKEAFDNGYFVTYPGRTLLIQPVGTSTPFWINCALDWGGVGYPLKRSYINSFNVSWATAKTGSATTCR